VDIYVTDIFGHTSTSGGLGESSDVHFRRDETMMEEGAEEVFPSSEFAVYGSTLGKESLNIDVGFAGFKNVTSIDEDEEQEQGKQRFLWQLKHV